MISKNSTFVFATTEYCVKRDNKLSTQNEKYKLTTHFLMSYVMILYKQAHFSYFSGQRSATIPYLLEPFKQM